MRRQVDGEGGLKYAEGGFVPEVVERVNRAAGQAEVGEADDVAAAVDAVPVEQGDDLRAIRLGGVPDRGGRLLD